MRPATHVFIACINGLLKEAGINTTILARTPERRDLIARPTTEALHRPILPHGHADVVTTENQLWRNPPFEGKLVDGSAWGRGALDMKGGVAMMLSTFLRAKAEGLELPVDVVLAILSDDEACGEFGARFLIERDAEVFSGIQHALGEFGGSTLYAGARCVYPIQLAEQQKCWMRPMVRGLGGHGSMPVCGGAMAKLSRLLRHLDRRRLQAHVTPVARLMFETMVSALGGPTGLILGQLVNPGLTNSVLGLLGERGRPLGPLLDNTVTPTILYGSVKANAIPSEVSVALEGRLLPGYGPEDMVAELRPAIGGEVEPKVIRHVPGPAEPDMGLFDMHAGVLLEADPDGVPVPVLVSGATDGCFFARLGVQTYGFLPMQLSADLSLAQMAHGADERIPADAAGFGADAIYTALHRLGG